MSRRGSYIWFTWLALTLTASADALSTWAWIGRATQQRIDALTTCCYTTLVPVAGCVSGVVVWTTNEVVQEVGLQPSEPVLLIPDLASTGLVVVGQQTSVWTNVTGTGTALVTNVVTEVMDLYDLDYVKTTNLLVSGSSCSFQVVTGRYVTLPLPEPGRRALDLRVVRWLADSIRWAIPSYVDMAAVEAGAMQVALPPTSGDWNWLNYTNLFGEVFFGWVQTRTNYPTVFPSLTEQAIWERTGIGTSTVVYTVTDRGPSYPKDVLSFVNGWEVGQLDQETVVMVTNVPRYQVTTSRVYHLTAVATTGEVVTLRRMAAIEDTVHTTNRILTAMGFWPDDLNGRWTWTTNGWARGGYAIVPDTNGYDSGFNGPWESWLELPDLVHQLFPTWYIQANGTNLFRVDDYEGYPRGCVAEVGAGVTGGVFQVSATWQAGADASTLGLLGDEPSVLSDRLTTAVVLDGVSNLVAVCGSVTNDLRAGAPQEVTVTVVGTTYRPDTFGRLIAHQVTNQATLTGFGRVDLPEPLWSASVLSASVAQVTAGGLEVRVESRFRDDLYGRPGRIYSETLMRELVAILPLLTHTQGDVDFWEVMTPSNPDTVETLYESYAPYEVPAWPAIDQAVASELPFLTVSAAIYHNAQDLRLRGSRTVNGERYENFPTEFRTTERRYSIKPQSGLAAGTFTTNLGMTASLYVRMSDAFESNQTQYRRGVATVAYYTDAQFNGLENFFQCTADYEVFEAEERFDRVWPQGGAYVEPYRNRLGYFGEAGKVAGQFVMVGPEVDTRMFITGLDYGVTTITKGGSYAWSGDAVCQNGNVSWEESGDRYVSYANSDSPLDAVLDGRWLMAWEFEPPP